MSLLPRTRERGSAASVVALLLLAALMALSAYVAWNLFLTPQLTGIRPNPVEAKTTVTLTGGRFAPSAGGNIVLFGDQTGRVIRATATELDAVVPDLGLPPGRQARVPVRVLVDGRASDSLELTIGVVPLPPPAPEPTPTPEPPPSSSPSAESEASPSAAPSSAASAAPKVTKVVAASPTPAAEAKAPSEAEAATAEAKAAAASLARSFVMGKTQVEGAPAKGSMKAFDSRDVAVRKPAEVPGRVEITATPEHVRAGDVINFKVYLLNDGKKPIRIQSLNVATTLDDVRQSAPVTPQVKEVAPGDRVLLAEIKNEWKPVSRRFRVEAQVASDRGETYTNILSWR